MPAVNAPLGLPSISSHTSNYSGHHPLNNNALSTHHDHMPGNHAHGNHNGFAHHVKYPSTISSSSNPRLSSSSKGRKGSRSEEESDHEYYNDLRQRELQPLQGSSRSKNETTV